MVDSHCLRMSYSSKIDSIEKCHLAEDNGSTVDFSKQAGCHTTPYKRSRNT